MIFTSLVVIEYMDSCSSDGTAYRHGKTYEDCKQIAENFTAELKPEIEKNGTFASPAIAYFLAPTLGEALGKKYSAMAALFCAIFLYPIPYMLTLAGYWPESGSWNSLMIYSFFVMSEVVGFIVGGGGGASRSQA